MAMICKATAVFKDGNKIIGYEILSSDGKRSRVSKSDFIKLINSGCTVGARLQVYNGTNIIRFKEDVPVYSINNKEIDRTNTGNRSNERKANNAPVRKENTTTVKGATLEEVVRAIRNEMRSTSRYTMEETGDAGQINFRHWGEWEVTDEQKYDIAYDEERSVEELEDEGYFDDFDNEELTDRWRAILSNIINKLRDKYTEYRISAYTGEKNWIYWEVHSK